MGGQSGVKSISGAWSQQAEKGAGNLDLSSKAGQMQRPPWGSLSLTHHVTLRNRIPLFFLSTKGDAASLPPCPLPEGWGAQAPMSFTGHLLPSCPPGTRNAGG